MHIGAAYTDMGPHVARLLAHRLPEVGRARAQNSRCRKPQPKWIAIATIMCLLAALSTSVNSERGKDVSCAVARQLRAALKFCTLVPMQT